ncbi:MAG: 16S rRNA (cytosine(1402)-N(4))-methyltransferase RsmH [Candidatus Glassbacteria bacterium]
MSNKESMRSVHIPVLLEESMKYLDPRSGGTYLDGTAGGGGHSKALLERSAPQGNLIMIDIDEEALRYSRERLSGYSDRVTFLQGNFADLAQLVGNHVFFDGILIDLGLSSLQLESARGFSFMKDEILDMRMNRNARLSASDLVNHLSRDELADIFYKYGEERRSKRIADEIVRLRDKSEVRTTADLAKAVRRAADPKYSVKSLARVFQAIRISVNDEITSLERGLPVLLSRLKPGGTIVVISYHSLEDRIVKRFFLEAEADCVCPIGLKNPWCGGGSEGERLTTKVVRPTGEETQANPRARSARLRAFKRPAEGRAS